MSILSALKTKGAKGNNIEEAVKTLPVGGGCGGGNLVLSETVEPMPDGSASEIHTLNVTFNDMFNAIQSGKLLVVPRYEYEEGEVGLSETYYLQILYENEFQLIHIIEPGQSAPETGAGYYFRSPFAEESNFKLFYSATPDGPMIYSEDK